MTVSALTPAEPTRRVRPTGYCTRCRRTKPRLEFWPNPKVRTGLSSWCKDCARAATKASREKHRDRYNAERRKPREERVCQECGERFETAIPHQVYRCRQHAKRAENRRYRHGRASNHGRQGERMLSVVPAAFTRRRKRGARAAGVPLPWGSNTLVAMARGFRSSSKAEADDLAPLGRPNLHGRVIFQAAVEERALRMHAWQEGALLVDNS